MNRRHFVKTGVTLIGAAATQSFAQKTSITAVPSYLKGYESLYNTDPRKAALQWFKDAKFGLFLHYGLYSILGRHEWVMFREKIPIPEYEKLAGQFSPTKFDADFITDLALEAGMKYINLTSKHHDSFCLFDTGKGNWNSAAVAGRDLCAELAEQCQKKGLGCFFYYSLFADWYHPYFFPRKYAFLARPDYEVQPEHYKFQSDADFTKYLNDAVGHIRTLLTSYGPVAGIWLDPIMCYYAKPDLFPVNEIYAMIRELQPNCLISAKQGANGTEDFAAPERSGHSLEARVRKRLGNESAKVAAKAWASNKGKPIEICDTLQPKGWGYIKADDGKHKTADKVMGMLKKAADANSNLLLNAGPLPDGSFHPEDIVTLRKVGKLQTK